MQKRGNSLQKAVTNQAFRLVNDQRKSEMANQMRSPDDAILRDTRAFLLINYDVLISSFFLVFCSSMKKITRAYLFRIALEIM